MYNRHSCLLIINLILRIALMKIPQRSDTQEDRNIKCMNIFLFCLIFDFHSIKFLLTFGESSNGRTADSGSVSEGSTPSSPANEQPASKPGNLPMILLARSSRG